MMPVFAKSLHDKLTLLGKNLFNWVARRPKTSGAVLLVFLAWLFCLPRPLFDEPSSVILLDREGQLLGARIATDGQWRFQAPDSLPDNYVKCLVAFEDRRFWWHPGIDPLSLGRALIQNIRKGRIVSGGSTITMQVIRMARGNPPRTLLQKLLEMFMATRLEAGRSKQAILRLYAAHAPFGGNVVGLEAAAWRYFGKSPHRLSWAEAATLAVLPNSPALIHPGRNRAALKAKRDRLLQRMGETGLIDPPACTLAMEEPLPETPLPLPNLAPHLLDQLFAAGTPGGSLRFSTTIDRNLQERVSEILQRRQLQYRGNEVHNLAAIVLEVSSGDVLAYVGNVLESGAEHGAHVDVVSAPRSTGSILKPYLYALALESGTILPNSLLHDVPTQLGRYKPENYFETYDGAVPAKRALIRSLNVPFVLLLREYGLEKFHFNLKRLGLTTLHKPPAHYGLSLILGGAEASLLDITNTYACMARVLGNFYDRGGRYSPHDFRRPRFFYDAPSPDDRQLTSGSDLLSAGAIWHTFEAMQEVERPTSAGEWELFPTAYPVAWKTGTSFGFRDAWAAGVTPRYAVGVWVGNADGEGRPGLIGVDMAAPVLFELFNLLPGSGWFDPPYDAMARAPVCPDSGFRTGPYCPPDTAWIPAGGLQAPACRHHRLLHLDPGGQWQVNSECEEPGRMIHRTWFVLPPLEEFYFKGKHPGYQPPPPLRSDCRSASETPEQHPMQLIYPKHPTRIYVPVDLDGTLSSTIFQVAHRETDAEIYWHLDGEYLGSTKVFHQKSLQPAIGKHVLTLVDQTGYRLEQRFEILNKTGPGHSGK